MRAFIFGAAVLAAVFAVNDTSAQRGPGRGGPGAQGGQQGGQQNGAGNAPAPMQREATEADAANLLDEDLVSDPAKLAAAREKAAQSPPASTDPNVLVAFYFERGDAARLAGNQQQTLQDYRAAVDALHKGGRLPDPGQLLMRSASAEADIGRRTLAIKLLEEAVPLTPQNMRGRVAILYTTIARQYVGLGNIAGADAAIAQAQTALQQFRNGAMRRNQSGLMPPGFRRSVAAVLTATAAVQEFRGRYAEGETDRRQANAEFEAINSPQDTARALGNRMALTTNLRLQGRLNDAENEARSALAFTQRMSGINSQPTGRALVALALVLSDQGRTAEAENLAKRSIEIFHATGLSGTGNVQQVLANIYAAEGKWQDAMVAFDTLRDNYKRNPGEFESVVRRNTLLPLTLLKVGRAAEAEQRLARMYEENKANLGEKHHNTGESLGFLAIAHAANGQKERALAEFGEASAVLLSRSRESGDTDDSSSASAQDQRQKMVLEAYVDLLADVAGTDLAKHVKGDPVAESFRLADAAHSRGVLRALAASAARAAASNPQLAESARRVQDAEKQIAALNGILANAISARAADRDEAAIKDLRGRIDALRDERGKTMREIERKFPDYARLVEPQPATVADIQKVLKPGEAMVAFYSGERRTYAWAVGAKGPAAMTAASLDRNALAASVQKLRKALDPNAASLDEIPQFDVGEAHRLYQALLHPTEKGWAEAKSLFVVPDGALGQLPLALLVTAETKLPATDADGVLFSRYRNVPFLARKTAVTQLPSVASLGALRALPAGNAQRRPFLGFGDPWFNKEQAEEGKREAAAQQTAALTTRGIKLRSAPKEGDASAEIGQLPRLADTAEEVRAVAAALKADPAQAVYIGAKASKTTLKSLDLSAARIVMFATHGLVPGDLSGLNQPALALAAPEVTGNPQDGLLTVEDILALKLNADWVVLSACNTAAAQGAGAEAVSGLGRAFFYAGTRALLVSNWPVETTSARMLTTDLFRRQVDNPALTRSEALRQAELALLDGSGPAGPDGKPMFAYAHPIFWAPFSLVGDGGGGRG